MKKQKTKLPEGWTKETLRYRIDNLCKELSFIPQHSWEMAGLKKAFGIYTDNLGELLEYYNSLQKIKEELLEEVSDLYNLKREE